MIRRITVGVISDTHGLLRPEALDALQGVAAIIHAGDVGKPSILTELEAVAPVHAIRGNVDYGPNLDDLPDRRRVVIAGVAMLVVHDLAGVTVDPSTGYRLVISGHTHRPLIHEMGGIIYFNPGSAGPRRFRLPVTLGLLHIENERATPEVISLLD